MADDRKDRSGAVFVNGRIAPSPEPDARKIVDALLDPERSAVMAKKEVTGRGR
jgi:hypothetical protein